MQAQKFFYIGYKNPRIKFFLFLIIFGFSFLIFFFSKEKYKNFSEKRKVRGQIEKILKESSLAVDFNEISGAEAIYKLYSVFKTEDNSFVLLPLVKGKLVSGEFQNEAVFRFPNGDLYSTSSSLFIPELVLRDGTKTSASRAASLISLIKASNGTLLPIELLNAEVIDGKIAGIFSARLINSGILLAGIVKEGKITQGYFSSYPTDVSKSLRVFGRLVALEELGNDAFSGEDILGVTSDKAKKEVDNKVLASEFTTQAFFESSKVFEYQGTVIKRNYDQNTYLVSGLEEEMPLTLNLFKNLVSEGLKDISGILAQEVPSLIGSGTITTKEIKDFTLLAEDLSDNSILSSHIKDGEIKNEDIADGAINSEKIEDGAITASDIKDDSIGSGELSSVLTFLDGDFLDLSAIAHDDSSLQGLRLPNTSFSPTSPQSGEGFIAWDAVNNKVIVYNGSSWSEIGGSISLYTGSSDTTTTSSVSGLELINTNELSLIRGCSDGEVLKWNEALLRWECASDSGAGGSGISTVQENDSTVVSSAVSIDFSGDDFVVTSAGGGEADIAIDYTNSGITRRTNSETITSSWTFNDITISDTNITLSGGDTILDLTGSSTRTLSLLNSTSGQVANLDLSDGGLYTGGVLRLDNSGTLNNITGLTVTSGTVSLPAGQIDNSELANSSLTINAGSGLTGGGSLSLGSSTSFSLGPLTSDWNQTGAFDIVLNNASSELRILESAGAAFYATLEAGDLSADATYTFSGASGTVLTTSNYSTTLDSVYVNTTESPAAGDISGSFSAGLTINSDSVALTTDTTGNYVAGLSAGNSAISIGGTAGEGWTPSVSLTLLTATDNLSNTTSSGSGLEIISGQGLGLLQGCSNAQILKWNETTDVWECSSDQSGGDLDSVYDADSDKILAIDSATGLIFNMTAGDFEIQTGGSAVVNFDQTTGLTTFNDDVTFSLAETEDVALDITISGTNSGQGQVITLTNSSTSGTQYGLVLDNAASTGTTEALLVIDNSDTDTAVTAGIQFVNAGGGFIAGIDMANLPIVNIGAAGTDFSSTGGLTLADGLTVTTGGATISAGGLTLTAGTLAVNSDSITSDGTLVINATNTIFLGDGTNGLQVDETWGSNSGWRGSARPTKRITLSPEYPGAALTGDGTNNSGTMTSDNMITSPYRNYYNWTVTGGTQNDYDIWIRIPIPSDFSAMPASNTLNIDTWSDNLTNSALTVTVYDTNGTVDCTNIDFEPTTANTWETRSNSTCLDGTYSANGIMTIAIKLATSNSSNVRVSQLYFDYLARF